MRAVPLSPACYDEMRQKDGQRVRMTAVWAIAEMAVTPKLRGGGGGEAWPEKAPMKRNQ